MALYFWVILAAAVVLVAVSLYRSADRIALLRRLVSWTSAAVFAGIAVAALGAAALMPTKAPNWLRELFNLGSGPDTAATPWARWALVVIAVGVILLPRLWGRMVWPEVALFLVMTIGIYATIKQHQQANKVKTDTPPPALTFRFAKTDVSPLGADVPVDGEAYVVVVRPKTVTAYDTVVSYESRRFKAKRVTCSGERQICVAVERGKDDNSVLSFTEAIESPTRIYLSPRE